MMRKPPRSNQFSNCERYLQALPSMYIWTNSYAIKIIRKKIRHQFANSALFLPLLNRAYVSKLNTNRK